MVLHRRQRLERLRRVAEHDTVLGDKSHARGDERADPVRFRVERTRTVGVPVERGRTGQQFGRNVRA